MYGGFDFGDFEITKREILASISIIAIMLLIGVLISSKISEHQMEQDEVYNKAVKIEDHEMFQYGLDTDIGDAFVYGDLKAVDTVTYKEIGGEYMYVSKDKEHYTRHTRQVAHTTTVNGKSHTYYTTEVYYTWDTVESDSKKCKKVSFCGVEFKSNKIKLPSSKYIDTLYETSVDRWVYYGTKTKFTGTIFAPLKDHTIPNKTKFYMDMDINQTLDNLLSSELTIPFFWLFWFVLTAAIVFGFYYLDNDWLE